jgi:hypothetical protein
VSAWKGNDLEGSVARFCLVLEEDRRTPEGRIRSSKQFREHYFPYDDRGADDHIFSRMPTDVRGPIIASWGIRGPRSAIKDTLEKTRSVVHDALLSGDIDDFFFEEGLPPAVIVRWADLTDWWSFWRRGPLTRHAVRKALEAGFAVGLYDASWFLGSLESRGGRLRGTDVIADALTKADLTDWLRAVHLSGDGSPRGLVNALGWESIVSKLPDETLLGVIDAMAARAGLSTGDAASLASGETGAASGPTRTSSPTSDRTLEAFVSPKVEVAASADEAPAATMRGSFPAPPPLPTPRSASYVEAPAAPTPSKKAYAAELAYAYSDDEAAARDTDDEAGDEGAEGADDAADEGGDDDVVEVDNEAERIDDDEPLAPPARSLPPLVEDDEIDEDEPGRYRVLTSRPATHRPPPLPQEPRGRTSRTPGSDP